MGGFLYAILCGDHVKIGWSSDPATRLAKINSDNPLPCSLIGMQAASQDDEKLAHAVLSHWRVSGEWFDFRADAVREFCHSLPAPAVKERLPIERIRIDLFGVKQFAFAEIAGTTQSTVSRWESGEISPNLDRLRQIREEAIARGLPWDDALFFDASIPIAKPQPERAA